MADGKAATTDAIPQEAVERVAYGLRYVAERQGVSLLGYDVEAFARAVLAHALASGVLMERSEFDRLVKEAKADGEAAKRRWAAAYADTDRQVVAMHRQTIETLRKHGLDDEADKIEGTVRCDKCRAPVNGSRDSSHKMGRLHSDDNTTADRWCRR